jgi:YbgC/YbaW family acyl-CoA thioester hydrolase
MIQLETSYTIRFNDCDPFAHLNNSKYIDYMLNAREDHLKQFHQLNLDEFYKRGAGWVVTGHEILYLRPANYNETVVIQSDLLEAGEADLLVEMRMWDETKTILKSILWTRFACVNIKTGRRDNHTPEFMEMLKDLVYRDANAAAGMRSRVEQIVRKAKAVQV